MLTVYKYPLLDHGQHLMPAGAELLHVAVQRGSPYVWARVDTSQRAVNRYIRTVGTGHDAQDTGKFVGTFMLLDGALVFHVFDQGEREI